MTQQSETKKQAKQKRTERTEKTETQTKGNIYRNETISTKKDIKKK